MPAAEERAKKLAAEMRKTMQEMKAAEARIKQLGDELPRVLAQSKVEAEAARRVGIYPAGRYQCASCGRDTVFTEPASALPACDNCDSRQWTGQEPEVTTIEPPPAKRYAAGMYECAKCGIRIAVAVETDELSPCDLCGAMDLKPLYV